MSPLLDGVGSERSRATATTLNQAPPFCLAKSRIQGPSTVPLATTKCLYPSWSGGWDTFRHSRKGRFPHIPFFSQSVEYPGHPQSRSRLLSAFIPPGPAEPGEVGAPFAAHGKAGFRMFYSFAKSTIHGPSTVPLETTKCLCPSWSGGWGTFRHSRKGRFPYILSYSQSPQYTGHPQSRSRLLSAFVPPGREVGAPFATHGKVGFRLFCTREPKT